MEQLSLEIQEVYLGPERSANPMVRIHGPGQEGARCGSCQWLVGWSFAKTYWKCGMRGDLTHGKKTDQRKTWRACGLYKENMEVWFEAEGTLEERIRNGMLSFEEKKGYLPNVVYMTPKTLGDEQVDIEGLEIKTAPNTLLNHFWFDLEDEQA